MKKLQILVLLVLLLFCHSAQAENGISENKIVFGQTAVLNGPASALGKGMNEGIMAAFQEVNNNGGVNGRKLELIAYDDGYEPNLAIENSNKLIHEDKVFALIGGVGTPTANAIEPIIAQEKVPFIGPFTGAEFLRNPFKRYVLNIRGSYWQETEEWVERLTKDLKIKRIAILYQDDTYGRAGLSGVKKALEKRNMALVGEGTYKRNTTAVKTAFLAIRKSNPEAIVMVGAYKPCAEFIKLARQYNLDPLFINISFVGSEALASELGEAGDGVIITQVVPFPFDAAQSLLVQKYQTALTAYKPNSAYGFISLEGYLVGRFVAEILGQMQGEITRESFLDEIYRRKDIQIEDEILHFGPEDNQGMDKVFITALQKNGKFTPITHLDQK